MSSKAKVATVAKTTASIGSNSVAKTTGIKAPTAKVAGVKPPGSRSSSSSSSSSTNTSTAKTVSVKPPPSRRLSTGSCDLSEKSSGSKFSGRTSFGGGVQPPSKRTSIKPAKVKIVRTTEKELARLNAKEISPEDILGLSKPCKGYLCKPSDNKYGIDFIEFKIRDLDHEKVIFHVSKEPGQFLPIDDDDETGRFVRYDFGSNFLKLQSVGTAVVFAIDSKKPVKNFRMIERHYFKDRLLKSFDFDFGFCMPGSTNSCEQMYTLPELSKKEMREMEECPYETRSDSFYFVEGRLVMHNRADYAYTKGGNKN